MTTSSKGFPTSKKAEIADDKPAKDVKPAESKQPTEAGIVGDVQPASMDSPVGYTSRESAMERQLGNEYPDLNPDSAQPDYATNNMAMRERAAATEAELKNQPRAEYTRADAMARSFQTLPPARNEAVSLESDLAPFNEKPTSEKTLVELKEAGDLGEIQRREAFAAEAHRLGGIAPMGEPEIRDRAMRERVLTAEHDLARLRDQGLDLRALCAKHYPMFATAAGHIGTFEDISPLMQDAFIAFAKIVIAAANRSTK